MRLSMRLLGWLVLCAGLGAGCGADLNGGRCEPACADGETCLEGQCRRGGPCKTNDDCQDDSYCDASGLCKGYADPMSINPMCQRLVPAGLLSPGVFCEWSAPEAGDPFPNHKQVLMTPLVMDFDLTGNRSGEFTVTKPSIVIATYDALDGACGLGEKGDGANFGILRILDGRTCKQQQLIDTHVNGSVTPAIGDLDGDGRAEIVTYSATGGVVAFKFDRAQGKWITLWTSSNAAGTAASNPFAGQCKWTGPTLADLDDDGKPETIAEGIVYDSTGKLVDASVNVGAVVAGSVGQFAVVADVDKDGVPNLIGPTGNWSWDKTNRRWQLVKAFPLAKPVNEFAAVGDLGVAGGGAIDRQTRDGLAEVVVVSAGELWVLSHTGELVFGKKTLPGAAGGGPPTIGDFDNDGRPEFAVAGKSSYTVYDPDCVAGAMPKFCATGRTDGVLWSQASQDVSSNITGSSLFDFEGNGTVEAVYADECFARIYDGGTGEVLFSQQHSSCTWLEYPVVADIQGSFRSKLIVPSNENCPDIMCPTVDPIFKGLRCMGAGDCPSGLPCTAGFCRCTADAQCNSSTSGGGFVCRDPDAAHMVPPGGQVCRAAFTKKRSGVRVFGDVLDRWVASRPTWNQHPYSISNVGEAGTIPRTSAWQRNWDQAGFDNFRQNVQGMFSPQSAPDTTAQGSGAGTGSCAGAMATLSTNLCNRGTAPVGDGVPVTFYEGGAILCTAISPGAVLAGQCIKVSCSHMSAMSGEHQITVVADDDGKGGGATSECIESNNRATFKYTCG